MVVTALRAAGIGGSILVILALVIYLLKTLITFIGFLTGAIKILIVLVFIFLIVGVGLMVLRGLKERRRTKE
jgi:multisubunit Na+/H+ antiporter MnhG subunit